MLEQKLVCYEAGGGTQPSPQARWPEVAGVHCVHHVPTELGIGLETASGDAGTGASTLNLDTQGSPFPIPPGGITVGV